ncbi:fibropellin-3-like [Anneissia japonica]|uniref:fibropellin-3-like n=1 Tax=Anneissia japonica TaxID=1529436 RepID=UPI0014255763|nr:fibropellin-3-like [Anneissia japonica]
MANTLLFCLIFCGLFVEIHSAMAPQACFEPAPVNEPKKGYHSNFHTGQKITQYPVPLGTTVEFKCNPGYTLVLKQGSVRVTCDQYARWYPPGDNKVVCKSDCTDPITPVYGTYLGSTSHGSTVDIVCDPGYYLTGPSSASCSNGAWTYHGQGTSKCTDIDECSSNPCLNGAVCANMENMYHCRCPPLYSGPNCEILDEGCASSPCINDGTCLDQGNNQYKCVCQEGYSGTNCDVVHHCPIEGVWYNIKGDQLNLTKTPSQSEIVGSIRSEEDVTSGHSSPTIIAGYAAKNMQYITFGYTTVRNNGETTVSWTGQCYPCNGQDVLFTTNVETERLNACHDHKMSSRVQEDTWTRVPPLYKPPGPTVQQAMP